MASSWRRTEDTVAEQIWFEQRQINLPISMTTKKKTRVSMDDILSRLPDHILDRILCFLPQEEAVRTCLLSKSWRHLGSSRSKLELSLSDDFNGDREKFMSVLYNTLQRYHHQSLFLKQLSLKMSSLYDATLRLDLPSVASKAEFLEELYLERMNLKHINLADHHHHKGPLFKHLLKLSLFVVDLTEENLETMLSSTCPLIEWLCIRNSFGFTNLNLSKARYLKHFELSHDSLSSIEVDVPTLETISIANCWKWCFLDNNYFPHLKSLCLTIVKLSSETFGFFTSKYMPSLEKLELERCYGCEEFQLSSSSIKYLSIIYFSGATKFTIDAPDISCFMLKAYLPVPPISFTPISSEWKSHLDLCFNLSCYRRKYFPGIHEIHQVLKSLSQSQITLKLFFCEDYQRRIVETNYDVFYHQKPVVVEGLGLEFFHCSYSAVQVIVNYLFRVCSPRYIYDDANVQYSRELTEILWKLLLQKREKRVYFWNLDLVEVSMESSSYDINPKEWRSVPGNSLSECYNKKIRFRLKWRGKG